MSDRRVRRVGGDLCVRGGCPHRHAADATMLLILVSAVSLAQPAVAQATEPHQDDIVVTATKRETSLQTTSAAISVVGSEEVATRHLGGADDYLQGLPGVSYQERGPGSNTITIRGIGQGSQLDPNSPVGTYFGETPVNGLGASINGNQAGNSDVKLVDVQQVEVLRGPQGTLYGSGTMGGTVRVVPNAPNLRKVSASSYGGYSGTARLGGGNYKVQAVVNTPLIEGKLAVRLVAYRFFDDGYYNNLAGSRPTANILAVKAIVPGLVAVDRAHIGALTTTGARGTVLFKPIDDLSVSLMYVDQTDRTRGIPSADVALGDYSQARVGVGSNGRDQEFVRTRLRLTNLVAQYDVGFGTFLNSTSFIAASGHSNIELTFYSPDIFAANDYPRDNTKKVLVNEARFASAFKGPLQILAGLYYENRRVDQRGALSFQYAQSPIPPQSSFAISTDRTRTVQRQIALFGEATLKMIDDRLTLVGGGRYFKFDIKVPISLSSDEPAPEQGRSATIKGSNWKGSISYELNQSIFVYGLFSEGFRAPILQGKVYEDLYDPDGNGLINFVDGVERKVPEGLLHPDSTRNYEIGINLRSANGAARAKLDGYIIDWSGIPIVPSLTVNGGAGYYINAGKARSEGVEFEASARVFRRLDLSVSASYTNSVLAEDQPGLGTKGTRLPGSARWNAHVAAQQGFSIAANEGYVRADYTWVGSYYSTLAQTPPASGHYGLVSAGAGLSVGRIDISVFAKNLFNSKAATWYDNIFDGRAYRVRPRTLGIGAGVKF